MGSVDCNAATLNSLSALGARDHVLTANNYLPVLPKLNRALTTAQREFIFRLDGNDLFSTHSSRVRGPSTADAADNQAPLARAEFFCGIYNSPDRVGFVIPNLPPGTYAFTIQVEDAKGRADRVTIRLK